MVTTLACQARGHGFKSRRPPQMFVLANGGELAPPLAKTGRSNRSNYENVGQVADYTSYVVAVSVMENEPPVPVRKLIGTAHAAATLSAHVWTYRHWWTGINERPAKSARVRR